MSKIKVEFEIDVPDVGCTLEEIEEWIEYSFHNSGRCSSSNPLMIKIGEAEPISGTFTMREK